MKTLRLPPHELAAFLDAAKLVRVSHDYAGVLGWARVDPRPWRKLSAVWFHVDGWRLEHCGHQTAIWPWDLHDARGRRHLTGALQDDARAGKAWPTLALAMAYVARRAA